MKRGPKEKETNPYIHKSKKILDAEFRKNFYTRPELDKSKFEPAFNTIRDYACVLPIKDCLVELGVGGGLDCVMATLYIKPDWMITILKMVDPAVNHGFLADKFSVSIFKDNSRVAERTPLPHQEAIETILKHIKGGN